MSGPVVSTDDLLIGDLDFFQYIFVVDINSEIFDFIINRLGKHVVDIAVSLAESCLNREFFGIFSGTLRIIKNAKLIVWIGLFQPEMNGSDRLRLSVRKTNVKLRIVLNVINMEPVHGAVISFELRTFQNRH